MRDNDDGAVRVNRGRGEQFHNGFAGGVVERGGRLVANNEAGLVNKRAGEGDALLLAAGKFARKRVEPLA